MLLQRACKLLEPLALSRADREQMKSNSDQRSESRFSTGVPVRTIRALPYSALTAFACLVPGFLIAWASSKTIRFHFSFLSHSWRCKHPVGGKHRICTESDRFQGSSEIRSKLLSIYLRRVEGNDPQRRCKALEFAFPVGQQRSRQHEQAWCVSSCYPLLCQ